MSCVSCRSVTVVMHTHICSSALVLDCCRSAFIMIQIAGLSKHRPAGELLLNPGEIRTRWRQRKGNGVLRGLEEAVDQDFSLHR